MGKEGKSVLVVAVVFLLLAIWVGYMGLSARSAVADERDKKADLNEEIESLKEAAKKEPKLKEQRKALESQLKWYVQYLPPEELASQERILAWIHEAAIKSQFSIQSLAISEGKSSSGRRGRGKKKKAAITTVSISLSGQGSYEQFLQFMNTLERHKKSIFRVDSFTLSPKRGTESEAGPLCTSRIELTTFWYNAR